MKRSGFTILEVIVASVLTAIALTVMFPAVSASARIFRQTAEANLARQTLVDCAAFIRESVGEATGASIVQERPAALTGYAAIWCEGNKLYYQKSGESAHEYIPGTAFALRLEAAGAALKIHIEILGETGTWKTDAAVQLPNAGSITGGAGTGIRFRTG